MSKLVHKGSYLAHMNTDNLNCLTWYFQQEVCFRRQGETTPEDQEITLEYGSQ